MSISYKDFKAGNFQGRRYEGIKEHPILIFLRKNRSKKKCCFTVKELVKATKKKEDTIRDVLSRMKKKGLIEHKRPYFVLKK